MSKTTKLQCSSCGADATASCDCGVAYVPAGKRAQEAVAASPEKSDRAIAAEIGVGKDTVRRARETTGANAPVAKRTGKDGKQRTLPAKSQSKKRRAADHDDAGDDPEFAPATPAEKRASFLMFADAAMLYAKYDGPIDEEILEAAGATAAAWCGLVEQMQRGSHLDNITVEEHRLNRVRKLVEQMTDDQREEFFTKLDEEYQP